MILWLISIAGMFALCLSGASHLLEVQDPALALSLNPFNTEARVNALVGALNADDPDLDAARSSAGDLISHASGDARGYSLLGAVLERQGETQAATRLYEVALKHSRTEIHALLSLTDRALANSNIAAALSFTDAILRRWPEYGPRVLPVVVAASASDAGRNALAAMLADSPPWRTGALRELVKNGNGLAFARDLLTTEGEAADVRRKAEVNLVVAALADANAIGAAHSLFLSTLGPEARARAGYIYDPAFVTGATASYFGWHAKSNGAAEVTLPLAGGGLRMRFLDSPARLGTVTQRLRLPPGAYRLEADIAAVGLEAPKGLYWRLACSGARSPLVELEVPEGSYGPRSVSAEFELPGDACALQQVSIETDTKTDSWRARYRGEVTFRALRISRL
ncbi:MAG: hypothetical protein JWQ89_2497 [Devosia sp.]|uniref:tetratricopeptide repeat protein n=1 Tax=Devosia sp. TaxID=1871048 RepID=UPI0026057C3C|nr:hypothetical protein [Devosia sp.]MDB5540770.1 hypothetical protein [Devosia sp.]